MPNPKSKSKSKKVKVEEFAGEPNFDFQQCSCGKKFRTARGLNTHITRSHITPYKLISQ